MKKHLIVKYGRKGPHKVHKTWLNSFVKSKVSYTPLDLRAISPKLGAFNQLFSLIGSLFFPKAEYYYLTSVGAAPATIFNRWRYGSKVISINSDTFFYDIEIAGFLKKAYMKWVARHVDAIISTSSVMKNMSAKHTKVPNEIVYPFCEVKRFLKVKPDYKSQDICSVATARHTKGGDLLPKILKRFRTKYEKSKLYVLGYGDLYRKLRKEKGIVCTGFADPAKYFSKCGLYVNPARVEPFGVNIIEAMCAGVPPLVTNKCGASDIVKMADPWLVSNVSAKEIAEKAIKLQSNIERKKKLGKKCRQTVLKLTKKKSTSDFKKALEKIYKKI